MNLRQLKIFTSVITEGGFTAAAKALHMAQPAVSIAIRKLEQELGLLLLHRADKIIPTAEGEVLLRHAQLLQREMQLTQQAMTDLNQLSSGIVRFSSSAMIGSYFFTPLIKQFKQTHPGINFKVCNQGTLGAYQLLDDNLTDMAIVNMDQLQENWEVMPLTRQEVVACVGRDHPLAEKQVISVDEFLSQPLIVYEQDYTLRQLIDQFSQESKLTPTIKMETDLLGMIIQMIIAGEGISLCLRIVTDIETNLVAIPFTNPITLSLGLGWKKNKYLSAANTAFVKFLEQETSLTQGGLWKYPQKLKPDLTCQAIINSREDTALGPSGHSNKIGHIVRELLENNIN